MTITKIRKPNALTPDNAAYWLRRHLCYVIQMMRETFAQLQKAAESQFDRNMHIESFHLHARNLIEFFKNKIPATSTRDASPMRSISPMAVSLTLSWKRRSTSRFLI